MSGDPPPCGLGDHLAHAEQSGFFSWFCLCPAGADEPPLIGQIDGLDPGPRFRPSGPRFHQLVELALALDERTCIRAASLTIARSFIDTPAIRPFARDLAKSFLNWVLPAQSQGMLRRQIALIGAFGGDASVVLGDGGAARPAWLYRFLDRGHEAAVFMGRRRRSTRRVGYVRVAFEHRDPAARCLTGPDQGGDPRSSATAKREGWLLMRVSGG